jgi:hypothetical protein
VFNAMPIKSPTTHKEIRAVAYKSLDELQTKLDELAQCPRASRAEIRAASAALREARALLQLTTSDGAAA